MKKAVHPQPRAGCFCSFSFTIRFQGEQEKVFLTDITYLQYGGKGNCWDDESMESFFGHMKDEVDFRDCRTLEEVRIRVADYIAYYNSDRY